MDNAVADVGTVVGARYRIEGVLGEGGMAIVYRARHTSTGKTCALKLVHRHLVSRPELVDLFVREAQIAGRIGEHPNIVNVFDAGVDDTSKIPFIAMELLNGLTLEQYVSQYGPLPRDVFQKIFEQLADAVEQAHRASVIHRDLKPSNLFLTYDRKDQPVLKVMDFGIAKILEQGSQRTATHIGSPAYAAPEQQAGAAMRKIAASQGITIAIGVSAATDVWAVGLIAYELLTGLPGGQFWSHAENLNDLLLRIALETPPPPSIRAGGQAALLPHGFDQWFERCLHKNAEARWQSVGEAVGRLLQLLVQAPAALGLTVRMNLAGQPFSTSPAPPNAPAAPQLPYGEIPLLPQVGAAHGIDTTPSSDAPTRVVASPFSHEDFPPAPGAGLDRASKDVAPRPSPALAPRPLVTTPPVSSEGPTRVYDKRSLEGAPANAANAVPARRWTLQLVWKGGRALRSAARARARGLSVVFARDRALAVSTGALFLAILMLLVALGLRYCGSSSDNAGETSAGAPSLTASVVGEGRTAPIADEGLPAETTPPSPDGAAATDNAGSSPAPIPVPSSSERAPAPESAGDGPTSRPKPAQTAPSSKLQITSKNGSCRVTINGVIKGYTPTVLDLPAGAYDVGCSKVGWKSGRKVTVLAGRMSSVSFDVAQ